MAHSTIGGMTDDDLDRPEPPSAKAVTALREARSLSRRADKLGATAAAVDDPTTRQLTAAACTSMEQLVHHLMLLERQVSEARRRQVVEPDSFFGAGIPLHRTPPGPARGPAPHLRMRS